MEYIAGAAAHAARRGYRRIRAALASLLPQPPNAAEQRSLSTLLLALLFALPVLLLPASAAAQNAAESGGKPQESSSSAKSEEQKGEAKNAGKKGSSKKKKTKPAAQDKSEKPADTPRSKEDSAAGDKDAAEAESADKAKDKDGPANAAESSAAGDKSSAEGQAEGDTVPANQAEAPAVKTGPAAEPEATSDTETDKSAAANTGELSVPQTFDRLGDIFDDTKKEAAASNAAEARPAGASATNLAEGGPMGSRPGGEAENADQPEGTAEPPPIEINLATPQEVGEPLATYQPPELNVRVPEPEPLPGRPADDSFYQPDRSYLEGRPLPGLDVTETDEELISRNIEESLKRINLGAEQRPGEEVQIPLANGVAVFKASDAFQFDRRNRVLTFRGNVEILINNIAIWGDLVEVNDSAATLYAKGFVGLQQGDDVLYCDEAYLNYDTQMLELFYVEGNTTGARLRGNVFFTAQRATGSFDRLLLEKVEVTTCDPLCGPVKEAHLSAHKGVYKRWSSIQLHDVYLYVREHKIMYMPLLAVPTPRERRPFDQEESDIQQNYGKNRTEGWFAKFAYTYSIKQVDEVNGDLLGVVKLDLSQKQGPGVGIRQDFFIKGLGVTTIRASYQRPWGFDSGNNSTSSRQSTNSELTLNQELNISRHLTGKFNISRKNVVVPALTIAGNDSRSNTLTGDFNLNYSKGKTQAALTANQNVTITGGNETNNGGQQLVTQNSNTTANFNFSRALSKELKFTLDDNYTASKGQNAATGVPADQEGTFNMRLDYTGKQDSPLEGWSAKLNYLEQGIDFDRDKNQTDSSRQIRKELPSLTISAPRNLFSDGAYFNDFDISFDNLVTGNRRRPESSFRSKIHAAGSDSWQFSHSSRLGARTSFDQYFYDDGNRQYVINQNLDYNYDSLRWYSFNANWNVIYQQGVRQPPVQGERQTYRQTVSYGATFTNRRSWRWKLGSGFDLANTAGKKGIAPNPLTSQFNWDPNKTFTMSYNTSYDLLRKRWGVSSLTAIWKSPYVNDRGFYNWWLGLRLTGDTDYLNLWQLTRTDIQWYKRYERGWSSEIIGSWRAGSSEGTPSDFLDLSDEFIRKIAIRKVNCCTTIEGGWRTGINEIYLNVFLNALPQYPLDLDARRPFDNEASFQPMFPGQTILYDIQADVFGSKERFF